MANRCSRPGRSGAASRAVGAGRGSATGSPASRLLRRSSNDALVHGRGQVSLHRNGVGKWLRHLPAERALGSNRLSYAHAGAQWSIGGRGNAGRRGQVDQQGLRQAEQAVGFKWKPREVILDPCEVQRVTARPGGAPNACRESRQADDNPAVGTSGRLERPRKRHRLQANRNAGGRRVSRGGKCR